MKKEDYELISEISNSYFPLIDFVNDLDILKSQGRLERFNYKAMQEDLVRIAKLFKYYHDEAKMWHDKYVNVSVYEADALRTIPNVLAKAEAFEILKKRFGIYVNGSNNVVVGNSEPLFRTIDKIKIKNAIEGE